MIDTIRTWPTDGTPYMMLFFSTHMLSLRAMSLS
jgi:hypothetical protein